MKLSVLMPVFNTARYLSQAIDSVCGQTFGDFEFIVVDDGSSDGSVDLIQQQASVDARLKLTTRPNRGLIATRNELIGRAQGTLIAWMDSDDVSEPDRFQKQIAAFEADPELVCVGTNARCIDPEGAPLNLENFSTRHEQIVEEQMRGGGMRFPTTMMRRDAVLRAGVFREPFAMGEDLDLLLRLGERGRLANIPEALYRYRQHMTSVCSTQSSRWFAYRDLILALAQQRREGRPDTLQAGGAVTVPPMRKRQMRRTVASTYAHWARCALDHHDRLRALRYAARAVGIDPLAAGSWSTLAKVASSSGHA